MTDWDHYTKSVIGAAVVVVTLSPNVKAQAQDIQTVDIGTKAVAVSELSNQVTASRILLDGLKKIVVQGQYPLNSWWLAGSEIEFKPGSSLVIGADVAKQSHEIFIVAKKITIDDPANPPSITWESASPIAPPDRGQASSGSYGGGGGASGAQGTPGTPGLAAPALTLMFMQLAPGPLLVNFKGGPGGPGGEGQAGGEGGPGSQGSHAQQAHHGGPFNTTIWDPWCAAGPGAGGSGGTGGKGGPGGTGGAGGMGGTVTLVSLPDFLPTITQAIRVDVSGGDPGATGTSGKGGNGGKGGPEGQLANFCNSAGRNGSNGAPGGVGDAGAKGDAGPSGREYVSSMTSDLFAKLFGF